MFNYLSKTFKIFRGFHEIKLHNVAGSDLDSQVTGYPVQPDLHI